MSQILLPFCSNCFSVILDTIGLNMKEINFCYLRVAV